MLRGPVDERERTGCRPLEHALSVIGPLRGDGNGSGVPDARHRLRFMPLWVSDLGAVFRRGWSLIVGGGVLSALGAGQQSGRVLYSHHHWHWPSWWWILPFFVGLFLAQQLVIRDRRGNDDTQVGSEGFTEAWLQGVTAHSQGLPIPQDVEYRASLTQPGGAAVELSVSQRPSGLPPTSEALVPLPESQEAEDQRDQ